MRSGTGERGRYFEVEGVPEALCETMSPRAGARGGRPNSSASSGSGCGAGRRRYWRRRPARPKTGTSTPRQQVWHALGQEHGLGPGSTSRLRRTPGHVTTPNGGGRRAAGDPRAAARAGPTVSLAQARALVFEAAAGRLSADEAARLLAMMECRTGGELLTLEGERVTSREIRQLEQHVTGNASRAARPVLRVRQSVTPDGKPGFRPQRLRLVTAGTWIWSGAQRSSC